MSSNLIEYTPIHTISGIHEGKRAIICGSGPSLNDIDFNKISKDNIIFACNQSVTVMNYCNYFCMTDAVIPSKVGLFNYGASIADTVVSLGRLWQIKELPFYESIKNKVCFIERAGDVFNFTNETLIMGIDVIHPTAHLAYIMGCSPIIFAGVDLKHKNNQIYCNGITYTEELRWEFVSQECHLGSSFDAWRKIKECNPGVKFLNASPSGRLAELFETIPIGSIYEHT